MRNGGRGLACCHIVFSGPFALALTAGMAATVNPCGFALLPAYLSAFVGLDDGDEVALVTQSSEEQLRGALFGGE